MPKPDKRTILAGRRAVEAYRTAHTALHRKPWHRGIPKEHTPLLNIMVKALKGLGFNTIQEFFDANEELNTQVAKEYYIREGECNQCGRCCEGSECYQGDGVCGIYEKRPPECIAYPLITNLIRGSVPNGCSYSLKEIKKPDIDVGWS